jgi:hypothetical protein
VRSTTDDQAVHELSSDFSCSHTTYAVQLGLACKALLKGNGHLKKSILNQRIETPHMDVKNESGPPNVEHSLMSALHGMQHGCSHPKLT